MTQLSPERRPVIDRRQFLKTALLTAGTGLLAACVPSETPPPTTVRPTEGVAPTAVPTEATRTAPTATPAARPSAITSVMMIDLLGESSTLNHRYADKEKDLGRVGVLEAAKSLTLKRASLVAEFDPTVKIDGSRVIYGDLTLDPTKDNDRVYAMALSESFLENQVAGTNRPSTGFQSVLALYGRVNFGPTDGPLFVTPPKYLAELGPVVDILQQQGKAIPENLVLSPSYDHSYRQNTKSLPVNPINLIAPLGTFYTATVPGLESSLRDALTKSGDFKDPSNARPPGFVGVQYDQFSGFVENSFNSFITGDSGFKERIDFVEKTKRDPNAAKALRAAYDIWRGFVGVDPSSTPAKPSK